MADTAKPDMEAVNALIERVEYAIAHDVTVSSDDLKMLLDLLLNANARLNRQTGTIEKLRKLAGLVNRGEPGHRDANGKGKRLGQRHRKRTSGIAPEDTPKATPAVEKHGLEDQRKGDSCPECHQGKLYKVEPASSLRVTGQPPFQVTQHVLEQLRCNACGAYFTAELPEEVLRDGPRSQQYGYSARALMAIYKNLTGMPYFRQQSLQQVMGVSISASTLYDQCKSVADLIAPVQDTLIKLAADAPAFALDDTGNRVLDQTGKQIPDRRTKKPKHRTGVYTSAVIATLDTGQSVYLFKTNIGHAGEWLDQILHSRQTTAPPLLMSDALNRNQPSVIDSFVWCKCNAHARREFYDCLSHVGESETVIEQYQTIWRNETHCEEKHLDAQARQRYHYEHSLPVMEQLREQCEAWLAPESEIEENSTFGKACQYFLNHYEGLSRFCYVADAKLDNNRVEQVLKLIILGRKNSLFYKTQNGADVGDILTSVLGTAVANGINVFDYLVALQQNWFAVGRNADEWLPWNYQETLQSMAEPLEPATA